MESINQQDDRRADYEWVYGYGRTKHILDPNAHGPEWRGDAVGLCGAYGGYPLDATHRPVCKRCLKMAAHIDGSSGADVPR